MSYLDRMSMLEGQVRQLEDARMQEARECDRLRSENNRLRSAVETVLNTFETDEAQGYRSKDRQYAISILRLALPRS